MLASAMATRRDWIRYWDSLKYEDSWLSDRTYDGRETLEHLVDTMLEISVPTEAMESLRTTWQSLGLSGLTFNEDNNLLWNLKGDIDNMDGTSDKDLTSILGLLKSAVQHDEGCKQLGAKEWKAVENKLPQFVQELKYCALLTLWRFMQRFSACTNAFPDYIVQYLYTWLFEFAIDELLARL